MRTGVLLKTHHVQGRVAFDIRPIIVSIHHLEGHVNHNCMVTVGQVPQATTTETPDYREETTRAGFAQAPVRQTTLRHEYQRFRIQHPYTAGPYSLIRRINFLVVLILLMVAGSDQITWLVTRPHQLRLQNL